jgi:hypothetical protein
MQPHLLGQTLSTEKRQKLKFVPIEWPLSVKKKCSAAQMVVRCHAVRQARVRFSARNPMEVPPTEPAAVKIWRWATANVMNE